MAAENPNCTVYVGNLDERVSDRVLYDILIQAGRVVDLYIPRDKETEKPKGFAFAQYETEEVADYAVKLFSGLVTLYKRTLKFAISGQDKPSMNLPTVSSSHKPRPHPVAYNEMGVSPNSMRLSTSCRFQDHQVNYSQVRVTPGVSVNQPNGYRSNYDNNDYEHSNGYRSHYDSNNYDYSRRVFGAALDNINRSRLGRYDTRDSTSYYASY
ncbi:unnamed protein product [Coffea canephora]|uniref:RRM domain-containing protein n=1 Tax=Coffea canephora TaxID=49390 RepID=A0A068UV57_COFCA|nr:unnamed protein product [Coffea canephora]